MMGTELHRECTRMVSTRPAQHVIAEVQSRLFPPTHAPQEPGDEEPGDEEPGVAAPGVEDPGCQTGCISMLQRVFCIRFGD